MQDIGITLYGGIGTALSTVLVPVQLGSQISNGQAALRMKLEIPTARVFRPLLDAKRYKGAHGGRGSGKSRFFAGLGVEQCIMRPTRIVCVREVQKSLRESSKLLVEDRIREFGIADRFNILHDRIQTPGEGLIIFVGMNDQTAESVKSLEGFDVAWTDEAQTLSERSLTLLRPTIRRPGSELWFSWNARKKTDPVDKFLRHQRPADSVVVQANWRDNPFFPKELEEERQHDLLMFPERYGHIWEGEYARAFEGAYFEGGLSAIRSAGQIGKVSADPLLPLRIYTDIGGAGAKSDAMSMWVCQFVAQEIRVLDYLESSGQTLAYHAAELRERGYDRALMFLPHDGIAANNITGKRYQDHWSDAGWNVTTIPNQGAGAAAQRIEAVRRILPKCWFDEENCSGGLDALGFYHEKKDPNRDIGLGPEHDWSSHAADAFGLMAISYEEPSRRTNFGRKIIYKDVPV